MLSSIVSWFQQIGDSIWGFLQTAKSFFNVIHQVLTSLKEYMLGMDGLLPISLATVVGISILIFFVKVILGASNR